MTDYYGNILAYDIGDEVIISKEDFELMSDELTGSGINIKSRDTDLDFPHDNDATISLYKANDSFYEYIKYEYYAKIEYEYFDLKKDFEALKGVYSDSVARYEELTGDYNKVENEYDVLSKKYDMLDKAYNRLEEERYDLKDKVKKLSADLMEYRAKDMLEHCNEGLDAVDLDKKITIVPDSDKNKVNETSKEVKEDKLSFNEYLWKWELK